MWGFEGCAKSGRNEPGIEIGEDYPRLDRPQNKNFRFGESRVFTVSTGLALVQHG